MARKPTGIGVEWTGKVWRARIRMPDDTRPYSVFEGIGEHERERAEQAAMTAQEVANSMRLDRKRAARASSSVVVNATARVASPVPVVEVEAFTVRRYCEELWIPAREKRGLPSVHDDKSRLRTHIYNAPLADGSTFGARPIAQVSAADLRAVVASLDDKIEAGTMAGKTARNVWGVVTKLFADAANSKKEALRVLPENPAKGIQPPERGTARERHVLYPSEVLSLLSCDRVPLRWKVLFAFAVYTYVRDGELEELRWKDVDLEHRSLYVNRAVDRYRDVGEVRSTKTKRNRKVDIEPALVPLLEHLKSGRKPDDLVVDMPPAEDIPERLRKYLQWSGVQRSELFTTTATAKSFDLYSCRHTGITWRIARGDALFHVKIQAGHEKVTTTEGYINRAAALGTAIGSVFPTLPEFWLRADAPEAPDTPGNAGESYGHFTDTKGHRRAKPSKSSKKKSVPSGIRTGGGLAFENDDKHREKAHFSEDRETHSDGDANDSRHEPTSAVASVPSASAPLVAVDPVEAALAGALEAASRSGEWSVVAKLASELEARRLARANVVDLATVRRERGAR